MVRRRQSCRQKQRETFTGSHWHYVTYGLSELYGKEWEEQETSGFGFELTFRLARDDQGSSEVPTWPLNFLQNIAKYVFRTGNRFDVHHHVTLNGPIALGENTDITGIALAIDPQLGEIDTKNGRLKFLQIVGLTTDEYELAKTWDCKSLLEELRQDSPLLVTDLFRDSILADEARAERLRLAAATDGSSQSETFGTLLETQATGSDITVRIAANIVADVKNLFRSRLGRASSFVVHGPNESVVFEPGNDSTWLRHADGYVVVTASPEFIAEFDHVVQVRRGKYEFQNFPRFSFDVSATEIKDSKGTVIRVVG